MARFQCRCGESLSNGLSPNDIQLRVYTDRELDEITNVDGKLEDLPFPKQDVWRCPKCERIYFFEGNVAVKIYALEPEPNTDAPEGVSR